MVYDGRRFRCEARLAGKLYGNVFGIDVGFAARWGSGTTTAGGGGMPSEPLVVHRRLETRSGFTRRRPRGYKQSNETHMAKRPKHKWVFRRRFRRHAFGWRSQPAVKRVKEAVSEIKKVARTDRLVSADGAVLFIEKVSPALEHGPRTTNVQRLRAWLYVVARNFARRSARSERDRLHHERAAAAPEAAPGPADELERVPPAPAARGERARALAEPYRSAIALRFFSELDYDEIAERQGVTNAAARQRVSRGARAAARALRPHGGRRPTLVVRRARPARRARSGLDREARRGVGADRRCGTRRVQPRALGACRRGLGRAGRRRVARARAPLPGRSRHRTGAGRPPGTRFESRGGSGRPAPVRSLHPGPPAGCRRRSGARAAGTLTPDAAVSRGVDRERDLFGLVPRRAGTPARRRPGRRPSRGGARLPDPRPHEPDDAGRRRGAGDGLGRRLRVRAEPGTARTTSP